MNKQATLEQLKALRNKADKAHSNFISNHLEADRLVYDKALIDLDELTNAVAEHLEELTNLGNVMKTYAAAEHSIDRNV